MKTLDKIPCITPSANQARTEYQQQRHYSVACLGPTICYHATPGSPIGPEG